MLTNFSGTLPLAAALGPAPLNFRFLLLFAPFPLLLLALLIVLPGIREQRLLSLLAICLHLLIGILLVASLVLPFWKCTQEQINVHLQAHSKNRHLLRLSVGVGLRALNISLDYIGPFDESDESRSLGDLHLNEQFDLAGVSSMASELQRAYHDGLPFPMLRVLEYFSLGQDAFSWGHQFRNAGHFAHALLWAAFGCWLAQCVLLPLVPHHFAKAGLFCGIFTIIGDLLYVILSPSDLHIAFPSMESGTKFLQFRFGACFWMSIFAGLLALLFNSVLILLQLLRLYSLSTFLDCSLDDTVGPPKCRFGGGRPGLEQQQLRGRQRCCNNEDCWTTASDAGSSYSRRLDSIPSCKFSVASSVSSLSVTSSICSSSVASITAARMPHRNQQRQQQQQMEPVLKSVELIRNRILARQQQQQQQGRETEEPIGMTTMMRRKQGIVAQQQQLQPQQPQ